MLTSRIITFFESNKQYYNMMFIAMMTALVLSGLIQNFLLNTIIFGYLSYKTIRKLNTLSNDSSPETEIFLLSKLNDTTRLLKNWTCFSVLITCEQILSYFFGFGFVSILYNGFKIFGLITLLQSDNNITLIYDYIVIPLFNRYESLIDMFVTTMETKANEFKTSNSETNYNLGDILYKYMPIKLFSDNQTLLKKME